MIDRQIDVQIDRQIDRYTDGQIDRQMDRIMLQYKQNSKYKKAQKQITFKYKKKEDIP